MKIFDMHCDTLTYCKKKGLDLDSELCALRLSDAREFSSYIQLYAVFVPDELRGSRAGDFFSVHHAFYRRQLEELGKAMYDVHTTRSLYAAANRRGMSCILAVEGGGVLGGELSKIEELRNAGVRSLTLTWNGDNEIAGGVLGEGSLTEFGREAVAELEKSRIAVDVSHLNDKSFWEVVRAAKKPVIASHSNARAVCPHKRNLTDEQFCEIARMGGVVGLNFAKYFITDGGEGADLAAMARHVTHFLSLGGENAVALGSDYDGAGLDECIDRPIKLQNLYEALLSAGVAPDQAEKLFFTNAYNYFDRLIAGEL